MMRDRLPRLDRRSLLRLAAATGGAAALAPLMAPGIAFAQAPTDRRLVLLILRGGMDGLSAVPPVGDPHYAALRPDLRIADPGSPGGALPLDALFGLHPSLDGLMPFYERGELAVLHAIATPYRERSHFDGQNLLENGTTAPFGADDGWLNRAISLFDGSADEAGIAISQALPLIMSGDVSVASWYPTIAPAPDRELLDRLLTIYDDAPLYRDMLQAGIDAQDIAGTESGGRSTTDLARSTANFLAAETGPRVAVMELGGWDTHANQGTDDGALANALGDLNTALTTLADGLSGVWDRTAILAVTEFGRTAAQNGTGGTDHGTASAAFAMGGAVDGGRVIAEWPGLRAGDLFEGRDLAPTQDMHGLFKAALVDHLGLPASAVDKTVFPDSRDIRLPSRLIL